MATRMGPLAAALILALALTACVDGSPGDGSPPPSVGATGGVLEDEGIDADTAKERGVFAADGDARLAVESAMRTEEGTVVEVLVTNVSSVDESYEVVLLSDGQEVGRDSADVAAGASATVEVTSESQAVTDVRLDGARLGEGVALIPAW